MPSSEQGNNHTYIKWFLLRSYFLPHSDDGVDDKVLIIRIHYHCSQSQDCIKEVGVEGHQITWNKAPPNLTVHMPWHNLTGSTEFNTENACLQKCLFVYAAPHREWD